MQTEDHVKAIVDSIYQWILYMYILACDNQPDIHS